MPETKTEPTLLERLQASRLIAFTKWEDFISAREKVETDFELRLASESKPTADELKAHSEARTAYRSDADQLEAEIKEWDLRIADQTKIEEARSVAADASKHRGGGVVKSEPRTYERYKAVGEEGVSYYRDLAVGLGNIDVQGTNRSDAMERLQRHAGEWSKELPQRAKRLAERARKQLEDAEGREFETDPFGYGSVGAGSSMPRRGSTFLNGQRRDPGAFRANSSPYEQRIEPNSTQGQGGYFIPPEWIVDEFIPGLRAHRVAAGLARQLDLPMGTNSINIPKLANLTSVGYQQANNAGLVSTDWTDTFVQANVKTIGGYSDVSIQLLEQSPNQIVDEAVTSDLNAAYNTFVDLQVVAGDGLGAQGLNGGHLLGLYPATNWSGTNTVTYTDGSPAGWKFPSVVGAMASQIARTRFDLTNFKAVMHGRRWFWYSTSVDANDRPLGESPNGGGWNLAAAIQGGLQPEGLVGIMPSVADAPVYIDDNVPTTDSNGTPGGGTADVAIGALWDDVWLFNGDLRTNIYTEIASATLGVRFQLYNYHAMLVRYGQSLALGVGTGFAPPTGAVSSIVF